MADQASFGFETTPAPARRCIVCRRRLTKPGTLPIGPRCQKKNPNLAQQLLRGEIHA